MSERTQAEGRHWALGCLAIGGAVLAAGSCSDNEGALDPEASTGGSTGSQGGSSGASGSAGTNQSGSAGQGSSGEAGSGAVGGGAGTGGTAGEPGGATGGAAGAGAGSCVYGDDASGMGGESGAGGDSGLPPGITVRTNPFVGRYLADSTGRPVYTWAGDRPGDCQDIPLSLCGTTNLCSTTWPPFYDSAGTLAPELDERAVGSVVGADPTSAPFVTTYQGWPLYYFNNDTLDTTTMIWSIRGHGVGRVWHLAKLIPYNVTILRDAALLYLGDATGLTLYTYSEDGVGADPVSDCTGTCLDDFKPFVAAHISAVSSLEPSDLRLFVRPDTGEQQVAFKGAPLYRAVADQRSGDRLGVNTVGFGVATP